MSDELATWLRARLDEDERVARALEPDYGIYPDGHTEAGSAYLERFDSERVLAEIAAKRQLLDLHANHHFCGQGSMEVDAYTWYEAGEKRTTDIPCLNLRLLALPYADRDGYREEWRP